MAGSKAASWEASMVVMSVDNSAADQAGKKDHHWVVLMVAKTADVMVVTRVGSRAGLREASKVAKTVDNSAAD